MKILITTEFYLPSLTGVVNHVTTLAACLRAMGHQVRIMTFSATRSSRREEDVFYIRSIGFKIGPDSYVSLALRDPLVTELVRWRPDIVHSHNEFFSMRFAKRISRKCSVPLVHTAHTNFDAYRPKWFSNDWIWEKFLRIMSTYLLRRLDCVISPSRRTADRLCACGIQNVVVVPNAIHVDQFKPSQESISAAKLLKQRLGIQLGPFILISVNRLSPEKNPVESIDLMALLERARIDAILVLVGEGSERARIEKRIDVLGLQSKVFLTGRIEPSQIHEYYHLGDAYISTSDGESQSLSYLEAFASGLPILCKEVHDRALEGVLVQGVNGYMFESHQEFVDIVKRMAEDKDHVDSMSRHALETSHRFNTEVFGTTVQNLYRDVIARF